MTLFIVVASPNNKFLSRFGIYILAGLLCLPLFFINVKDSHDWGGDFAMYIMQSGNIVEGIPQSETNYIFNEDYQVLGPPAYPVGFPLLLAPVYALSGNDIKSFTLYITSMLFVFGLLLIVFFRKYFSDLIALFLMMLVLYNYWTLMAKLEIMSDIPFALILLVLTILYTRAARRNLLFYFLVGVLSGLLMSVRSIGIAFVITVFLYSVLEFFRMPRSGRQKAFRPLAIGTLLFIVTSLFLYFLLNKIIFPLPVAEGVPYLGMFGTESVGTTILNNLTYYIGVLKHFFTPENNTWQFASLIMRSVAFTFIMLGMINQIGKKTGFIDILVLVYLGILMIYPYRHSGFRFLFPVVPYIMYYLVKGLQVVKLEFFINRNAVIIFLGVFALLLYKFSVLEIMANKDQIIPGPQEQESVKAFNYIKNNTPEDAVVVFIKPRVLALYANRNSLSNNRGQNLEQMKKKFDDKGVDYLLIHNNISDPSLKKYVELYADEMKLEWQNEKFKLYAKIF